jgi:AcrR family transcriptional regulator
MQVLDERKRRQIAAAAARLFARAPYHAVTLDAVAAAARVGKGTLYLYFRDKDHLYVSLLGDGLGALVERVAERWRRERSPWDLIRAVVGELVDFASANPAMFEVLRPGASVRDARLDRARARLRSLLVEALRAGAASGRLYGARAELTAAVIPSLVRGALLFGPKVSRRVLSEHLLRVIGDGIRAGGRSTRTPRRRARAR